MNTTDLDGTTKCLTHVRQLKGVHRFQEQLRLSPYDRHRWKVDKQEVQEGLFPISLNWDCSGLANKWSIGDSIIPRNKQGSLRQNLKKLYHKTKMKILVSKFNVIVILRRKTGNQLQDHRIRVA